MQKYGYINLFRKIQDNPLWLKERFTKMQAWIDLILLANFEDKEVIVDYKTIIIKRGQHMTSQAKLAKRWRWDRQTVNRFLTYTENEKMLSYQCHKGYETGFTVITILNYDEYQSVPQGNPQGIPQGNHRASHINNKENKDNIDSKESIQAKPDQTPKKVKKLPDPEIDKILAVFEEINGTIPVDAKPRQWGNHIKKLLAAYIARKGSSLAPSDSLRKFLINKRDGTPSFTFNKLQTIYYHLRAVVYKNEKPERK